MGAPLGWPSPVSRGAGAFTCGRTLPHRARPRRVTIPLCVTLRALLRRAQNGVVSVRHRKDHRPQAETGGHHQKGAHHGSQQEPPDARRPGPG
jgi:hypothetical protein